MRKQTSEYDEYDRYDLEDAELRPTERTVQSSKKKKKPSILRRLFRLILLMACLLGVLIYITGMWKDIAASVGSNILDNGMKDFSEEELTYQFTIPDTIPAGYAYDQNIINILLVGIEGIGSSDANSGRSDSMMLCSYNLKSGEIKLVSFLRDTCVELPGRGRKKLNAAYAFGKMDLLIETIQSNYKILINGVARVNFEEFEQVIDLLGGVDIELTKTEAEYLNKTNYISDKANRTVVPGMNHLNGNQALGYCRVRYVPTMDGDKTVSNDYGRTLRQRKLLTALFDSYKNCDKTKLFSITNEILNCITSSLTKEQLQYCLEAYLKHPADGIKTQQIPAAGYFKGEKVEGAGDCLIVDFEANTAILHHFIYGTALPADMQEE